MKKWFTIPEFNDEENNNRAYQLTILLLLINITLFIDHTVLMFTHSQLYIRWISTSAFIFAASLFLFWLLKKGQSLAASYMFIGFCWIINFGLVWTAGGIKAPEVNNFIFMIFISGYLLGTRAGLIMIALTSVAEFFLVYAENNGLLPATTLKYDGYSLLVENLIFLCIIAYIHYSFTQKIQTALTKATKELKERINTESKLKSSNRFLIKAQKTGKIGTFELDLINDTWTCSENLYELLGIVKGGIQNFNAWLNHIHPEDKTEVIQYYVKRVLEEKKNFDRVYRILRPNDGNTIWVWGTGEVECDEMGNPLRIIGIIQDITDRKNYEIEMRKLSEAIKQSPVSIVISDVEGRIEYVNPYFSKVSGFEFEEIVGTVPEIKRSYFHYPEDYEKLYNNLTNGRIWHGEMQSQKKTGEFYWESVSLSPLTNSDGEKTGYLAVKEHISEKIRLASDLEKALAKSEESDRLKSSLMSNMSHEFRTPMNGILGMAAILKEINTDTDQQRMLDGIVQSGKRLMNTLDAILEFSNLESEIEVPYLSQINISEVANNIVHDYRVKAIAKGLCFKAEICDTPLIVNSLEKNITQIFHQLLDNALKFTQKGFIEFTISTETFNNIHYAKIVINDSGIGISAEHQMLIFEEFRQVSEGFSRNYEGSGLGLALVKKIISLLNGRIKVESSLGDGTIFTILIPIELNTEMVKVTEKEEIRTIVTNLLTNIESEIKTLLVEDNQWNRDVTESYLAGICKITHAEDGPSAIRLAGNNKFDLIFMDINLGMGINGIETTKEIRKIQGYDKTPIVALTGYAKHKDKEYFLTEGLTHFMPKPFEKKDLIQMVAGIFSK